jgi:hypothetical protein
MERQVYRLRREGTMLSWTAAYIAAEWVIRIAMLVYVPQRRTPAAARTWLLLVGVLDDLRTSTPAAVTPAQAGRS